MIPEMTKEAAKLRLEVLSNQHYSIETEMINLALEYNLDLELDRGKLIVEDNHWSGRLRGDWLSSSDVC